MSREPLFSSARVSSVLLSSRHMCVRCLLRQSLVTVLLLLLLLTTLLGNFVGLPMPIVFAASKPQVKSGSLTLQRFLQMGRQDGVYRGSLIPPTTTPKQAPSTSANNAKPAPSAEPPTMKPISRDCQVFCVIGQNLTSE